MERKCIQCGEKIRGRSDKKYCDENCRNNYNNSQKAFTTPDIRIVNHLLKKNRSILDHLLKDYEEVLVTKEELLARGFSFYYFTHQVPKETGGFRCGCYDTSYEMKAKEMVLVRRLRPIYAAFQLNSKPLLNEK